MGGKSRKSGQISKALIDRIKSGSKNCGKAKNDNPTLGVDTKKTPAPDKEEKE